MHLRHKTPCSECPFRRASAPGWLGADTPEGFVEKVHFEVPLPCHRHLANEGTREQFEESIKTAPYCAGALIMMRNSAKVPRDPEHAAARNSVVPDHASVFSFPAQFIDHHRSTPTRSKKARG